MIRATALLSVCIAILLSSPSALAGQEGYDAGNRCPDFELYDTDGKLVRLSEFRGKVVLLHFFATW